MNHTGKFKIKIGKKNFNIKFTNLALYNAQKDLGLEGLEDILNRVQKLDLGVIFSLLHCALEDCELSIEELMLEDLKITQIAVSLSEALIQALGSNEKK